MLSEDHTNKQRRQPPSKSVACLVLIHLGHRLRRTLPGRGVPMSVVFVLLRASDGLASLVLRLGPRPVDINGAGRAFGQRNVAVDEDRR